MKVLIAKTAGFCMGVRRAVELALDAPSKFEKPIYTYGPLIHNPQVLELFAEKGISTLQQIPEKSSGTVLVRAHGVPPETKSTLKQAGFHVVDATCPRVIRVQTIIRSHAANGYATIIIGDADHPEVVGLRGFAGRKGHVAASAKDLDALPDFDKAIIVAQTTQNMALYDEIKQWALHKHPHYKVFDTICGSTERRQAEVKALAEVVDAIVVVGGRNSGNTQRLAEIARQSGKPAFHVETENELDLQQLGRYVTVGLTAGASTPNWIINRVYRQLEHLPIRKRSQWVKALLALQRTLLLTNLYVALGAGCLAYAGALLQGFRSQLSQVLMAVLYVLSMHILNHLTGRDEDRFNDPDREQFYQQYKIPLTGLAFIAGAGGLIIAVSQGLWAFLILLWMSVTGLSYNLRLIPRRGAGVPAYRGLRDIPGSKTILIAVAWGVVTTLLPAMSPAGECGLATLLVFLWSTSTVFVRTAFFDLLDTQGDRIVGKETIALLLGEARSLKLLKSVLAISLMLLVVPTLLHITTPLGYALTVCPLFLWLILSVHQKGEMLPGVRLEFLAETLFVMAGAAAFIWSSFRSL